MSFCRTLRIVEVCRNSGHASSTLEGEYRLYDGTCMDTSHPDPAEWSPLSYTERVYKHTTTSGVYIISNGHSSTRSNVNWLLTDLRYWSDLSCRTDGGKTNSLDEIALNAWSRIVWHSKSIDEPHSSTASFTDCWNGKDLPETEIFRRNFQIECLDWSSVRGCGEYYIDDDYPCSGSFDDDYSGGSGTSSNDQDILSTGVIVGITVEIFLLILSIVGCICCCACRKSSSHTPSRSISKIDSIDKTQAAEDAESPLGSAEEVNDEYGAPVVATMIDAVANKEDPTDLEAQISLSLKSSTRNEESREVRVPLNETIDPEGYQLEADRWETNAHGALDHSWYAPLELRSSARGETPIKVSVTETIDSEGRLLETVRCEQFLDGTTLNTVIDPQLSSAMAGEDIDHQDEEWPKIEDPKPTTCSMENVAKCEMEDEDISEHSSVPDGLFDEVRPEAVLSSLSIPERQLESQLDGAPMLGQSPRDRSAHSASIDECADYVPPTTPVLAETTKAKKKKKKSKKKPSSTGIIGEPSHEGSKRKKTKKPASMGRMGEHEPEKKKKSASSSSMSSSHAGNGGTKKKAKKSSRNSSTASLS